MELKEAATHYEQATVQCPAPAGKPSSPVSESLVTRLRCRADGTQV